MRLVLVVVLAGCGRFGFEHRTSDQSVLGDAAGDVLPADAPPPTGPFGAALVVASVNTAANDDDPALTGDQLEIFFDSSRAGGLGGGDLWTAARALPGDPFDAPTNVMMLNTAGDDTTPEVSRDGLTIYFAKTGSVGLKDLWMATRPTRAAGWSAPTHLLAVSTPGDDAGPSLSADGLELYFATDIGGNDDLYVSRRASMSDAFPAATAISELNTSAADHEPWINGTKTFVVFSSDRGGNSDLYMARRSDPMLPWEPPQPMSELNTAAAETDPWLSPDERIIYFARGGDIYMATR